MSIYSKFKYNLGVLEPNSKADKFINKVLLDERSDKTPIGLLKIFWSIKHRAGDKFYGDAYLYTTGYFIKDRNNRILQTMSEVSFLEFAYSKLGYNYSSDIDISVPDDVAYELVSYMSSFWNGYDILVRDDIFPEADVDYNLFKTLQKIHDDRVYNNLDSFLFSGSEDKCTKNQLDFISIWLGSCNIKDGKS